jgi:hypothetical protein
MKKQIKGYVVYRTAEYYADDERFHWTRYDPRHGDSKDVFVCEQTIEIEVPEKFDPRPAQVAQLVATKEEARKQFAALCTEIDRRINQLLALEMAEEEQ